METLKNREDIIRCVSEDRWMMTVLKTAKSLDLPDWWVCAGFVRSKIWDMLHGFERTPLQDVDVIYFDPANCEESVEKQWEKQLRAMAPDIPWSVKNEARMHRVNHISPYMSSVDAISKFPETATALGLKLNENTEVVLASPLGVEDVIHLEVKPTPYFLETPEQAQIYEDRLSKKNWKSIWEKLKVFHI